VWKEKDCFIYIYSYSGTHIYISTALAAVALEGKQSGKCVAIGECGLDYDRFRFADKKTQLAHFDKHFVLTEKTGLPMFLHSRSTGEDFNEYVRTHRARFSSGVVHSFTGSLAEMQAVVAMGLYIGINGCSLRTEEGLEVAKQIPRDRLLIETDAPWCSIKRTHPSHALITTRFPRDKHEAKYDPETDAGGVKGRCEPSHIVQVLEVLAKVRGEDPAQLAAAVYKNSTDLFFPDGV
jgi:TatD DNase family protein